MKLAKWIDWFIAHPAWTVYLMKTGVKKRLDVLDHNKSEYTGIEFSKIEELVARHFSLAPARIKEIIAQYKPIARSQEDCDEFTRWDSSPELCILSYCLCRLKKPAVAVETGTARGFLAAAMLQALYENGQGILYSLELPPFGSREFSYAGSIIPKELRSNWRLQLGPSVPLMKKLFKKTKRIDFFIHDSDHSYLNQKTEYEIALRTLNIGGILISDDVKNDAFQEVADAFKQTPIYVNQKNKKHPIGLIFKRDA